MTLQFNALTIVANITALLFSATAFAAQAPASPSGFGLYVNYCGSCHGPQAKGDGPAAAAMQKKPADLTAIAKRNGGKFPTDIVSRTIDGRNPVLGHGGQGMPVWSDVFLRVPGATGPDVVQAKIEALVKYLESIQQK
jgi:mono/diheme cytochrome c family protein